MKKSKKKIGQGQPGCHKQIPYLAQGSLLGQHGSVTPPKDLLSASPALQP